MIPVYSRQQWGARAPERVVPISIPQPRLWLHHSADDRTGPTAVQDHQRYHMDARGYVDIAYNWLADADRIYMGRGPGVAGGHTAGDNSSSHAVCMLGNFDRRQPSDLEISSAAWAAVWAWRQGAIHTPAYTGGHKDAPGATTACPGRFLYAAIGEINRRAAIFARDQEDTIVAAPILVKKINADGTEAPELWQIVGRTRSHISAAVWRHLIVDEQGRPVPLEVRDKWIHKLPHTHEVWGYPVLEDLGGGAHEHTAKVTSTVRLT